jgi:1-deoxy-D-xylulose-5-phosphate reductoisomerase
MKKIALLGSSGSIGQNTLEVVRRLPKHFTVEILAVKSSLDQLHKDVCEFQPQTVVVFDKNHAEVFKKSHPTIKVLSGPEGLKEAAADPNIDFVMQAMSGSQGLEATIAALKEGKTVGLANKELLIMAGDLVKKAMHTGGGKLIPVDSEHNAIFQCLQGRKKEDVEKVIITASGGPFWNKEYALFHKITVNEALSHPSWSMGPKVTIDSSTMMNKGFEIIEASLLFDLDPEQIEVTIHPQSHIHSFVQFKDGSLFAHISPPDMKIPIQHAMSYPDVFTNTSQRVDFNQKFSWNFSPPDDKRFPCLSLAYEAMRKGKSYPCFLNAADEVLVDRFLNGKISWIDIGEKLSQLISFHQGVDLLSLEAIYELDAQARTLAKTI